LILHQIHWRVFQHIKSLAEQDLGHPELQ
jgi:hypothetical protein